MNAGTLSARKIFESDRQYQVPLFQRPYVWKRELQWEPLWEDIRALAERILCKQEAKPHFLGAIVLDQIMVPTGNIEKRLVIDGQQRLTTLQLFLEAFCDLCANEGAEKYHKALLKLTRNDDPMSEDADEQFKIWPTNVDQDHFRRALTAGSPEELRKEYAAASDADVVGHPVADGYLFFHRSIHDWLTAMEHQFDARLDALYVAMRDYIRMVVIDLEDSDDPQMIFETLNARGTPLLPSDLVKNYLFHKAKMERDKLETLYSKYWNSFDARPDYWRQELGRGHAKRARIDIFILHYLTAKKSDEVPVGHLYNEFRNYAENSTQLAARDHLASLHQYADVYRSFDSAAKNTRTWLFFQRLQAMDIMSAYPFLLELFVQLKEDQAEVLRVLEDLESFLVRRMVCQLSTRGYNRLFVELLDVLNGPESEKVSLRVRNHLMSFEGEDKRWPKDGEFRRAWLATPVYRVLMRQRVRMLLEALERQLHTGKTEKLEFGEKLTIEHLMPVGWMAHWPLPDGVDQVERRDQRERAIHTIGNLTLLTKKLNPSVSNGAWPGKSKEIHKYSLLKLNLELSELALWDEEAIRRRGEALFQAAVDLWPR